MAGLFRAKPKRVTDPLDDEARARLVGGDRSGGRSYASSGSEHSAADGGDDSPCLSELVYGFLEEDRDAESVGIGSDSDRDDSVSDCTDAVEEVSRVISAGNADPYRNLVAAHASAAAERFGSLRSERSVFVRRVMAALRERGHNAAVCKTRWAASGGLTAGSYEFVDVVGASVRYVVGVYFAAEFEIARPTSQYSRLLQSLPRVFVGRVEELKRLVRITCDAARRSLRSRDLSVPPWRKNRYMQQKWLGPYRRTTNAFPTAGGLPTASAVQCRYVGFGDAANGRVFVRTR